MSSDQPKKQNVTRRDFMKASAAVSAFTFLPRHVFGGRGYVAPSEKVNIAIVGAGGQGRTNTKGLLQHNDVQIVAVCDVNEQADYSRFF